MTVSSTLTLEGSPSMTRPIRRPLTLPAALYGFVGLGAILFALLAATLITRQADAYQAHALEEAVQVRTQAAAASVGRALDRDWTLLQSVRRELPIGNPTQAQAVLSVLTGDGKRIAWAGFAAADGTVRAASGGMLVGADVSERPWFQQGLAGPFAGDLHDAVLLNQLLGGSEDDPIRFLDLAAPVTGPDGRTAGVVGFHIQSDWMRSFLTETAESLKLDLFLIDPQGRVVAATADAGASLDLPSVRAATAGARVSTFETWPDGRRYFTTVAPDIAHGTLPSFGWRLVGRIDPTQSTLGSASLRPAIVTSLAGAGLLLLLGSVVFARLFLAPVAALARTAERIADGEDDYPEEIRRTEELATLSAALARLGPSGG